MRCARLAAVACPLSGGAALLAMRGEHMQKAFMFGGGRVSHLAWPTHANFHAVNASNEDSPNWM